MNNESFKWSHFIFLFFFVEQTKFASRSRGWRDVPVEASRQAAVHPLRVRMEQKMNFCPDRADLSGSLREAVASATEAWIEASLTHVNLSLKLSSVTGLTAFIEDELSAPVIPLFINLRDIECSLIEDRPPVMVGGPPPVPAPPMVVRVKHLLVQRNHAGIVSVGVNDSTSSNSVSQGETLSLFNRVFDFQTFIPTCIDVLIFFASGGYR